MASQAARQVAYDVLESIGKGKRPNITKLAVNRGYSYTTAKTGLVQKTKTFQAIVGNHLDVMKEIRDKALGAVARKDMDKERLPTLISAAVAMTHDIQLLSGGKTENVGIEEDRRILLGIVHSLRNTTDTKQVEGSNTDLLK